MTTLKHASIVLLGTTAVLGLALALTAPSFGAGLRHPHLPAPPVAADSALLSQVSRAQAAAVLTQHPSAPVTALLGL